jgi:hypothetical protein
VNCSACLEVGPSKRVQCRGAGLRSAAWQITQRRQGVHEVRCPDVPLWILQLVLYVWKSTSTSSSGPPGSSVTLHDPHIHPRPGDLLPGQQVQFGRKLSASCQPSCCCDTAGTDQDRGLGQVHGNPPTGLLASPESGRLRDMRRQCAYGGSACEIWRRLVLLLPITLEKLVHRGNR